MPPAMTLERARANDLRVVVTWWNRLEPRPRAPEVASTVAAKVRDPLWMLTRQWQFGEFQGEDAASPAWIQLRGRTSPFVGWRARPAEGAPPPLQPIGAPLEELVETDGFAGDLAVQAELGLTFGQLLLDEGLTAVQRNAIVAAAQPLFPLDTSRVDAFDENAQRFLAVCGGRAIDGAALAAAGATAALLAKPAVAPFAAQVTAAVAALQASVARTYGAVGPSISGAWHTESIEYDVDVVSGRPAGGSMLLRAVPDRDATFEWFTMDLVSRGEAPALDGGAPPAAGDLKVSRLPTFVRFRGMPNHRWWDFERGTSDFGSVIPDKRDLAKLLVMDFMLIHGNDFFVVPIDQPVGTAAKIDQLLVHDVFGGITLIDRADAGQAPADARWTCFSTSIADQDGAPADFFLLPPSAGAARIASQPIEDVRFVRDEQANLVWAIEYMTAGGDGRAWSGRQRHVASTLDEPKEIVPVTAAPLYYRLQSFVPWHWFPLLPVKLDVFSGEIALERGQMVRPDGVTSPAPIGRLLEGAPYRVREESVPRTGVKVTREAVRSRWLLGDTHLWIARRKTAGRGEGSSGLRYDEARATPPPAP
jgi:hypothetical protein